ncbi:MAG: hypothetical protein V2A66_08595 [Pseudomonadota bacterium]
MKRLLHIALATSALLVASCSGSGSSFTGWQTESFDTTAVTASATKTFVLGNASDDNEQHIGAIAFDSGSNAAGNFRIDKLTVSGREVPATDIVIPPGSALSVQVTYAPLNLETSQASYGGWITGEPKRWIPKNPADVGHDAPEPVIHRSLIEAVYDHPKDGIYYVQLVGEAKAGPGGEVQAGGANATCTPGSGTACYTGKFALDIPQLAPGGPKPLEMTGPIRMSFSGGSASMRMDDFPFVIYYLRSTEIPKLPSGTTATLVISGATGTEAAGTFDGSRLSLKSVTFRIRVALGELTVDQVKQGMSALVDFNVPDLEIQTIKPLSQGAITLHLETTLPQNPSGNELFDQFLSGVKVIAVLEGELAF